MNSCCEKTDVAVTILKLKFTKLDYFSRLFDFLWHKNTIQKLRNNI